jgi:hypothetical protein
VAARLGKYFLTASLKFIVVVNLDLEESQLCWRFF